MAYSVSSNSSSSYSSSTNSSSSYSYSRNISSSSLSNSSPICSRTCQNHSYSYRSTLYGYNVSADDYLDIVYGIWTNDYRFLEKNISKLLVFAMPIYRSDLRDQYSKPMLWIGMYIAFASLLCVLAMLADLLHGLRNRKFWIPSSYFKIDAAFLLLISIAMKLPVDLSGSMPGDVDQVGKLGSIAFMCTMMANLLPSFAAMDNKELLANITAMGILVITLVVNVCIQISTGVVSVNETAQLQQIFTKKNLEDSAYLMNRLETLGVSNSNKHRNGIIATTYVTILLLLLIILVCSSLAILKSKKIIELKYQLRHETASEESPGRLPSVEKLKEHLRKYWIMAESGNPQFIAVCFVTATASGVLCVVPAILHTVIMFWTLDAILGNDCGSDYKWTMLVIVIVQFIGVIVGTIAPFLRCFATLSFKVSKKIILNHIMVFKVESYWSSKLSEWKQDSMPFPFRDHKLQAVIHYSRNIIISFCILLQEGVVVMCKTIALIPFFMICVLYCFRSLKKLLKYIFQPCVRETTKSEQNKDLGRYVLQLEDELELAERTLKGLLKSMDRLIQRGGKRKPKNLINLVKEKSKVGFPGVEDFEDQSLRSEEYQDCWSLPVVNLTAIAVSLPGIEKPQVDNLLRSVGEGLKYITLVEEETLDTTDDYARVRKAAKTLWSEVDFHHKWLENALTKPASSTSHHVDKTRGVIEWFKYAAEKKLSDISDIKVSNDDSTRKFICANSMCRITETILLSYKAYKFNDDKVSQMQQVFDKLSTMIADIIAACLTNLPQVIVMKCHKSTIEKRGANVRSAAKLLGETEQIIMIVQERQPPNMDTKDMPFIGKWRAYLADLRNP